MLPNHLPSFQAKEYVHRWLSSVGQEIQSKDHNSNPLTPQGEHAPGHRPRTLENDQKRHDRADGRIVSEGNPPLYATDSIKLDASRPDLTKTKDRFSPPPPAKYDDLDQQRGNLHHQNELADEERRLKKRRDHPMSETSLCTSDASRASDHQRSHEKHEAIHITQHDGDPSDKYARRPRNKTRSYRYELKEVKEKRPSKRDSKRNKLRRPGVVLNEQFQAPNVHKDRLTLKQAVGPGIFAKGKVSAPVDWQGLPDLTFSEMKFLSKKREYDDARFKKLNDKSGTSKTRKASDEEISHFFSRPDEDKKQLERPWQNRVMSGVPPNRSSNHTNNVFSINGLSVRAGHDLYQTREDQLSQSITHQSQSHHTVTASDLSASGAPVSWSASPQRDTRPLHGDSQRNSMDRNRASGWRSHHQLENDTTIKTPTIHPMSSASNHSLKKYTDRVLLAGASNPSRDKERYLSLEDLKHLAARKKQPYSASYEEEVRTFEVQNHSAGKHSAAPEYPTHERPFDSDFAGVWDRTPRGSISLPASTRKQRAGRETDAVMFWHDSNDCLGVAEPTEQLTSQENNIWQPQNNLMQPPLDQEVQIDIPTSHEAFMLFSSHQAPQFPSQPPHQPYITPGFEFDAHECYCIPDSRAEGSPRGVHETTEDLDEFDLCLLGAEKYDTLYSRRNIEYGPLTDRDITGSHKLLPLEPAKPHGALADARETMEHQDAPNDMLESRTNTYKMERHGFSHTGPDVSGLITRMLEGPTGEPFTGLSRRHILY